jgi:iron complex outermembrane receptor protein
MRRYRCLGYAAATATLVVASGFAHAQQIVAAGDSAVDNTAVETIVVTGERIAVESGKSDIPLLETPQVISIISADTIRDRGIVDLADALRPVAGVSRSSTYGYYDAYQIRGFDAAYGSVYLDGLISANVAGANNELAELEQVEVVKGPASMLYGSAPLGGIVNLVSKRPKAEPFTDIGLATGSYGLFETTVDANAPLTKSGDLLARVNLVLRESDDFVKFSDRQRVYIAPALTWKIAPATALTLLARYERNRDSPWSPLPAWGTVLPSAHGELPIDFSVNNADPQAEHNQDYKHIGYVFEHAFSEDLGFSQTLRYTDRKVSWNDWLFAAGFADNLIVDGVQQGHVLSRYVYGPFSEHDRDFAVDSRLNWKIETGPLQHTVLGGIDYWQSRTELVDRGGDFSVNANTIDILDPDYSSPLTHDPLRGYNSASESRQTGVYLQDHIAWGERATLTIGGRQDAADSGDHTDKKFSPRVGATVMIVQGVSIYASWSKSFTPQPGYLMYGGKALAPETGRNVEGGLKVATADGRLQGTMAVFELTRQNVATEDPAHPFFYVLTGEQRSRGFEFETTWLPLKGATVQLAYTYLDAVVTQDEVFPVGMPLANVPRHNVTLYGEYVLQRGALAGLGVNASYLFNSGKNATLYAEDISGEHGARDGVIDGYDDISFFDLPSYSIVDAGLSYKIDDWQLRLNIDNVFGKRYFPDACCLDRVTPGEPRNWRASLSRSF